MYFLLYVHSIESQVSKIVVVALMCAALLCVLVSVCCSKLSFKLRKLSTQVMK